LSANVFAIPTSYDPLVRAAAGAGLALAAFAAIGCASGVAGATPQQPVLVDDPVPAPAPAVSGNGVNIANAIFGELGNLLNVVLPGSGSLFMPATSDPSLVSPGGGYPSTLAPGYPGVTPPTTGYPGTVLPGQTPGLPAYPGTVTPGAVAPGQTPALPTPPGIPAPAATSPVVPAQNVPVV
jgi:hypothetical protein